MVEVEESSETVIPGWSITGSKMEIKLPMWYWNPRPRGLISFLR
jgi:hypothetical protein